MDTIDRDALSYYDNMRKEIEREDTITFQRLTATLTFHGFLITYVALVFGPVLKVATEKSDAFELLRGVLFCALAAPAAFGSLLAISSLFGILASTRSLNDANELWLRKNEDWKLVPEKLPQFTKQKRKNEPITYSGELFALAVPLTLLVLWVAYLFFCIWFTQMKITAGA